MKISILTLLSLLLLSSCAITNTPGFYSGYKKLQPEQQQKVVFLEDNTLNERAKLSNKDSVYAVSGSSLLSSIKDKDTTIVYFWSVQCHSSICIALSSAQNYCDKKGYNLIVIQEYYDKDIFERLKDNKNTSIFMVNHKYYKTDYCNKYKRLFSIDLDKYKVLSKDERYSRFYVFHKDKLISVKDNIFD